MEYYRSRFSKSSLENKKLTFSPFDASRKGCSHTDKHHLTNTMIVVGRMADGVLLEAAADLHTLKGVPADEMLAGSHSSERRIYHMASSWRLDSKSMGLALDGVHSRTLH